MNKEQEPVIGNIHSTLAKGTVITGTITSDHDLRIDGDIEGTIQSQGKVILGKDSHIKGDLECTNAEINGAFEGQLKASKVLTLHATAKVKGDISIATLIVEPGAVFNGNCTMLPSEAPAKK